MLARVALAAVVAFALPAGLSGCLDCQPLLDVRHCSEIPPCAPVEGDPVVEWTPDLAQQWPQLADLIEKARDGKHQHAEWTQEQTDAFWADWNVPAEREHKALFVTDGEATFRVRVLTCE